MGTERSQAYKNYTQKCPIKNVQSLSPGFLATKIQQEPRELTKLPKKPTRWYLKMSSVYHLKMQRNLLRNEKRTMEFVQYKLSYNVQNAHIHCMYKCVHKRICRNVY